MRLDLSERELFLLYYISKGYLAPVDKLLSHEELWEVLDHYSYKGELYSLPYLFFVDSSKVEGSKLTCFFADKKVCHIEIESTYRLDFGRVAEAMFQTSDVNHPGVADLCSNFDKICVSGTVHAFNNSVVEELGIPNITLDSMPEYAFQSRNPPHAAHETIIRHCLSRGPLVYTTPYSTTKSSDYSFNTKLECYRKIKDIYNVELLVTLLPRVFAGPREALQNVLLFRNFGCKHFVMGRGKNCVADYYGPLDSYEFCKKYEEQSGVEIIFEPTQYANNKELKASDIKTTYIDKRNQPPQELMSGYISEILLSHV